jgi:hypothetical protein
MNQDTTTQHAAIRLTTGRIVPLHRGEKQGFDIYTAMNAAGLFQYRIARLNLKEGYNSAYVYGTETAALEAAKIEITRRACAQTD